MSILDLSERGALVVGGGQGMGRATALLLARAGANVAVVDLEQDRVDTVRGEIEAIAPRLAWSNPTGPKANWTQVPNEVQPCEKCSCDGR